MWLPGVVEVWCGGSCEPLAPGDVVTAGVGGWGGEAGEAGETGEAQVAVPVHQAHPGLVDPPVCPQEVVCAPSQPLQPGTGYTYM